MSALACTQCKRPLASEQFNTPEYVVCNSCGAQSKASVFPALYRVIPRGQSGEAVLAAQESTCFYHEEKKAVVPCEGCGRFLCALCDMEINGRHLCPTCMERGVKKGKLVDLENQRTLYDSIALALATIPILSIYFTLLTAPAAIYVSIRYWNAPSSILPRGKARFVIAIVLAAMQLGGWVLLFMFLIYGRW